VGYRTNLDADKLNNAPKYAQMNRENDRGVHDC